MESESVHKSRIGSDVSVSAAGLVFLRFAGAFVERL